MELYLRDDKIYHFSNDPLALATLLEQQRHHVYLIKAKGNPKKVLQLKIFKKHETLRLFHANTAYIYSLRMDCTRAFSQWKSMSGD
jgi:hypothetical protein